MNTRALDFMLHSLIGLIAILTILVNAETALFIVAILQFFVGIFQLVSSAIRMFWFHSFDKTIQKLLVRYWILCALYIILQGIVWSVNSNDLMKGIAFFSAWGIAIYYCVITYLLAFPSYRKSHLEI